MKVGDDELASLRRDAEGFDGVITAVLDELLALRKVADAAAKLEVAMDGIPCRCGGMACEEMCRALREAGR